MDLDSEVWRGTCNLSGGQQQLLSLARAALRSSPVLVLDEPSSALDQEAEQTLHSCLEHLFKDRTILLVAVSHFHYNGIRGMELKIICIIFFSIEFAVYDSATVLSFWRKADWLCKEHQIKC